MKTALLAVLVLCLSIVASNVSAMEWTNEGQGYTWEAATELCASKDMRLPTMDELYAVDYAEVGLTYYSHWSSEPYDYMDNGWIKRAWALILYNDVAVHYDAWGTGVRTTCVPVAEVNNNVIVPTTGYYKFRMEEGNGVITVLINDDVVVSVDTTFSQGEIPIGNLVEGDVVTIQANDMSATAITEVQLDVFPWVEWIHDYATESISLVLFDPNVEPECTQDDLDTLAYEMSLVQDDLSTCNADYTYQLDVSTQCAVSLGDAEDTIADLTEKLAVLQAAYDTLLADDGNNGHGNDADGCDDSNPGLGKGKGKGPKQCR